MFPSIIYLEEQITKQPTNNKMPSPFENGIAEHALQICVIVLKYRKQHKYVDFSTAFQRL